MVYYRVDASHGESPSENHSIRGFYRFLLEPKAIGEELQEFRWEKVVEFLKISIVQGDDAEIVLAEEF
jgi:hypothetical protein